MHLLFYIQIKPAQEIRFGNPFAKLSAGHDVQLYDADNHSDEWVISHQAEAISQSDKITVILDVLPDTSPGKITKILERLLRQKGTSLRIFIHGHNLMIDKMLKMSKSALLSYNDWSMLEKEVSAILANA